MTPALRGPLRNHFWKKRRPQPYWGGENSENALEPSNALNCSVWGIPTVLSRGIPGKALRALSGSFRKFSGISSRKSQPYGGCGLLRFTGGECTWKDPPKTESSSGQDFLNNFCWLPDLCQREAGRSSSKLFEKVRVNAALLSVFLDSEKI